MSVINKRKVTCSGCNACAEACPKHCIEMVPDRKGFLYPKVNEVVCIDCGVCERVCPFEDGNKKLNVPLTAYAAWNKDREQHLSSSSGGAAYVFSSYIIKQGGIVYGCTSEGMHIRHIRVASLSETAGLLKNYDYISVREQQTMEIVMQLTDADYYTVTLDPTLLVEPQKWSIMAGEAPLIKGNYIFLYTPWYNADVYEEANRMSKTLKIPIVVSLFHDGALANLKIMRRHYNCLLASCPLEFLNLCKFATYTIGESFHLVAFSILFRKPFFAINGMEDSRVIDLLKLTGLEQRSVSSIKGFSTVPTQIDFDEVHHRLADARKQSLNWLRESLC